MKAVSAKLTVSSNEEEFAKLKDRVGNAEREIQELKQLVEKVTRSNCAVIYTYSSLSNISCQITIL